MPAQLDCNKCAFSKVGCTLCELSPTSASLVAKMNAIIGNNVHVSGIENIQTLNDMFIGNDMTDVITLVNEFFSIPVENLNLDDLQLTEEKSINGIPVQDFTDIGIDITKIIDFSKIDISEMTKLQFGISIPTITFIKSLNFTVMSIDIQFVITGDGFSWAPYVEELDTDTALERLNDISSIQPVKCVDNPTSLLQVSLEGAKALISANYNTPETHALLTLSNIEDFNAMLESLGIILTKEINVSDLAKESLNTGTFEHSNELDANTICGILPEFPLVVKPFSPDDLLSIEKDCCSGATVEAPIIEDETILEELPNDIGEEFASVVEKFINDCAECTKAISDAAEEKQNATNAFYWYTEAQLLNNMALEYAGGRILMLDEIFGDTTTKIKRRDALVQKNIELKKQESSLYTAANTRLNNNASTINAVVRINGVSIDSITLSKIENDATFISQVTPIRNLMSANKVEIDNLTSQIEDVKKSNQLLTSNQLQTVIGSGFSSMTNRVKNERRKFKASSNPISNQIGFDNSLNELKIYLDPRIVAEAQALFNMGAINSDEISSYIEEVEERTGTYGTLLWNKFYSANRIDNFFTYTEQGYLTPKPTYSESGESNSPQSEINLSNVLGDEQSATVDSDVLNIQIDQDIAVEFLQTIEDKTKSKVIEISKQIINSDQYIDYIAKIKESSETEAKIIASIHIILQESNFTSLEYDTFRHEYKYSSVNIDSSFTKNLLEDFKTKYSATYDSLQAFDIQLTRKLDQLNSFIQLKNGDIADGEQCLITKSEELNLKSDKLNAEVSGKTPQAGPEKDCKQWLGSDPTGRKPIHDCPDFTKNCYWAEYTKILQLASLMPIPELSTSALSKRLFRYYPVGLQIPVVSPTGVLPTLAMGIPDIMISIPFPLVWKHIVTLSTPLGTFVIWIALCGPIPCPYIMYIDEGGIPSFLVTLKGPISIPANSLGYSDNDLKPLLEVFPGLKDIFRLNISLPAFPVVGNSKLKTDPDDPKNVIAKIQEKLKTSIDGIDLSNWSLAASLNLAGPQGPGTKIQATKDRLRDAMRYFPPDVEIIQEALHAISNKVESVIDDLSISPIKIPKNPKKLIKPVIGPAEIMDDVNALKDAGLKFPAIPIISLRDNVKSLMDEAMSSPAVSNAFNKIDEDIALLEQKLSYEIDLDKKVTLRTKQIKDALAIPLEKLGDIATPERLGFLAAFSVPIPSPVPCYSKKTITPIPPFYFAMITIIKQLGQTMENISDDEFQKYMQLDLTKELPRMKDISVFMVESFMNFVPDLKYPDPDSFDLLKTAIKTSVLNLMKLKIRMPHAGGIQITITEDQIKTTIKVAVMATLGGIVAMILEELDKAVIANDIEYVIAVMLMIKAILGVDISDVTGDDIKALLSSMVAAVNNALEPIADLLTTFEQFGDNFESFLSKLFPAAGFIQKTKQKAKEAIEGKNPLFFEISTQEMLDKLLPVLNTLNIPFPVVQLACANTLSRKVITKIHPFDAREILPPWEKLSTKNVPFIIWLDQLIATAQKTGGIGSDYVTPYYMADL